MEPGLSGESGENALQLVELGGKQGLGLIVELLYFFCLKKPKFKSLLLSGNATTQYHLRVVASARAIASIRGLANLSWLVCQKVLITIESS